MLGLLKHFFSDVIQIAKKNRIGNGIGNGIGNRIGNRIGNAK